MKNSFDRLIDGLASEYGMPSFPAKKHEHEIYCFAFEVGVSINIYQDEFRWVYFVAEMGQVVETNADTLGRILNPAVVKSTEKHNYFTSYPVSAKKYARRTDPDNPVLVRTIGIKNNFPIELDPDSKGPDGEIFPYNCRTTSSIPSKFVVGSKHSAPKDDAKVFKEEMGEAGYNVSLEQAGRLLREVQSDSDDDF